MAASRGIPIQSGNSVSIPSQVGSLLADFADGPQQIVVQQVSIPSQVGSLLAVALVFLALAALFCLNTLSGGQPLGSLYRSGASDGDDGLNTLSGGQPLGRTGPTKEEIQALASQYPLRWAASWQLPTRSTASRGRSSQYPLRWAASWQMGSAVAKNVSDRVSIPSQVGSLLAGAWNSGDKDPVLVSIPSQVGSLLAGGTSWQQRRGP